MMNKSGELEEDLVTQKFRVTTNDGKDYISNFDRKIKRIKAENI